MIRVRAKITAVSEHRAVAVYVNPEDWKYVHASWLNHKKMNTEIDIVIETHKEVRSLAANNLFHAIVDRIAKKTTNPADLLKQYIKETYGVCEKIVVPHPEQDAETGVAKLIHIEKYVLKSTAKYTVSEMNDIIMGAIQLAADEGVDITDLKKSHDESIKIQSPDDFPIDHLTAGEKKHGLQG